jgi:murein DD-endopeptidase MepM/ murein hydrolase activator NlpD
VPRPRAALAAGFLAVAFAGAIAEPARADTFSVVVESGALPSYSEPNAPGSIAIPANFSTPPLRPELRSYGELLATWRSAGTAYGVPWQILAAINKIESNFGRNMGPSSAGALGWMQFMPSTWMRWGTDADGDGVANPWDPEDAIYSAARYLAAAGAHDDLRRALFAYNHADWYVESVLQLARGFGEGGAGVELGPLPPPGAALNGAAPDVEGEITALRRRIALATVAVLAAETRIEKLEWQMLALADRAGNPSLSERRFLKLERKIARLARAKSDANARLERRRDKLARARARLEELRQQRSSLSATAGLPALASGIAAAVTVDGYAFPVGGGPDNVSVPRTHHDYPAVDIGAPEGTPLYALADSSVVASWPTPRGRCGIGFEIVTFAGVKYLYCHLSYLEPSVVPGAALAAGAPVGLLGATGNATGPHLHLQLVPALAYPQVEPWFEAFAGTAFRWQDGGGGTEPANEPDLTITFAGDEQVITFSE